MPLDKKTLRNIFFGVGGCILLYWLLHETARFASVFGKIFGILSPFLVGAALAFILNVPMRAIERMLKGIKKPGLRRGVAILCTLLSVALVLTGVIWLLVPQIAQTVDALVSMLPDFFRRIKDQVVEFLETHPEVEEVLYEYTDFESINWGEWIQKVISLVTGSLSTIADRALSAVVTLSNGIFNAVLSLVFGLYCLSRKEILARQGRRIAYSFLPEKVSDEAIRILRMTNATFSKFISGQCLEAVILGCMFAVAMSIFRMPFMPLVSVIIAVTALVPIVGAFVGCILGAFFILVQDPMLAFWFVIMFLIIQQIEGNMIYPRVVGTSIGLPGMWVLLAVAVGGDTMGIGGMLLMIPLTSVLYALAREITDKRLAARGIDKKKLQDQPPEITSKLKEKRKKKKEEKYLKKLQELTHKIQQEKQISEEAEKEE